MTSLQLATGVSDEHPRDGSGLAEVRAEKTLDSPPHRLWSLWTTQAGLESWWCPEGFVMTVEALEVRPGGEIDFRFEDAATAGNPRWRDTVRAKGFPTTWVGKGVYLEVDFPRRLAFRQTLDFGPRSARQEYRMSAEFRSEGGGTRLAVRAEAAPSRHWTLLGESNLIGQLDRLSKLGVPVS